VAELLGRRQVDIDEIWVVDPGLQAQALPATSLRSLIRRQPT
jgi:hypothetical protein